MAYEAKPNAGYIWKNRYKKPDDMQPYFKGTILLDKVFIENLIAKTAGANIEIAVSVWTGKTKDNDPYLSAQVSEVYKSDQPKTSSTDEDLPDFMR